MKSLRKHFKQRCDKFRKKYGDIKVGDTVDVTVRGVVVIANDCRAKNKNEYDEVFIKVYCDRFGRDKTVYLDEDTVCDRKDVTIKLAVK